MSTIDETEFFRPNVLSFLNYNYHHRPAKPVLATRILRGLTIQEMILFWVPPKTPPIALSLNF